MEKRRIETFDDWKDLFQAWQKDIGYDTKRNRVLVPLFQDNVIEVYDVK